MTDLQRLVALIATNLAASDPGRLHRPIPIAELMERILPYRSARRQLGLVTTEEYELLILRLAAGEEGLARTEPADTLARFRLELDGVHPDLHVLTIDESAAVVLSRDAVARAREGGTGQAYAPPGSAPAKPVQPHATEATQPDPAAQAGPAAQPDPDESHPRVEEVEILEWEGPGDVGSERCSCCGGTLPTGRAVNFCPHCGQSLRALHCPACNEEVELGWKHCVSCGAALSHQ